MEFSDTITVSYLICLAGLILFARWLLKTSLGRKALADSVPRRNNMPVYLPFVPLFICFGTVSLITSITKSLFGDLHGWQNNFLGNLILCISELMAIVLIIFLARVHFARRLKGFGLNVKTIVKDFFAAFVNLLTVWPLITATIILTMFFGKHIWGQEYEIQQHQQLKLIAEYPQLPLRIMIFFVAVVIASLFEEMVFRGLFQTTIRSYFESRLAAGQACFRSPMPHQLNSAPIVSEQARYEPFDRTGISRKDNCCGGPFVPSDKPPIATVGGKISQTDAVTIGVALAAMRPAPRKGDAMRRSGMERYGAWAAILISSGLFAATHAETSHWPAMFVLGLSLGYAYEKSGSLFRPIFIHSLFNAVSILAALK